jgi:hypothetical protein
MAEEMLSYSPARMQGAGMADSHSPTPIANSFVSRARARTRARRSVKFVKFRGISR